MFNVNAQTSMVRVVVDVSVFVVVVVDVAVVSLRVSSAILVHTAKKRRMINQTS